MKKRILLLMIPFLLLLGKPIVAEEAIYLEEEIIYDILVDRFNIGDLDLSEKVRVDDPLAYHGGDILGITKKLDRIQDLGFSTIVLSPIMKNAADGYHGYWIEDFYAIEGQFGTMQDLDKLIEEAHGRGIKVVLELVTNYVALSHPFVEDPGKEAWFKENTVEQVPATEWLENVAVLDQDNSEVATYLYDVAEFWMTETAIDGFRLHDADQSSIGFLETLTEKIKEINSDFYILAGVSEAGDNDKIEMLRDIDNIGGIENRSLFKKMNEVFTEVEKPISILYDTWEENKAFNDILLVDNKNTARFSNNFADNGRNAITTWKLALTYMYTTPGIPIIYQGSELPMYGPGFPDNQHLVLFNSTDPDLEEFLDRISSIKQQFPVLSYGDFEQVGVDRGMSVFKRTYEDETMYVAINNDEESRVVSVSGIESGMKLRGLLEDNTVLENKDGVFRVGIPRESAEVYIIEKDTGFNWVWIGLISGVFLLFILSIAFLSHKQKKRSSSE